VRRLHALLVLIASAALAVIGLGGCGLKGITKPLSAPDTFIFVEGPVDTVNHIVHLHWFGTDANGYILGYEARLLNPAAPADTTWGFTTHTDSVITVLTPSGFTAAVFEVRAINDHGVRDPDPARQLFNFRNQPPVVRFVGKPNAAERSDTTFASVTVDWTVSDLDGDATRVICRLWLDGHADAPLVANGSSFTMPSAQFLQAGAYRSGLRTLYIQGIDDGGMAGPVDSVRWYVRQPVSGTRARLLLVDDIPHTDPAKTRVDTLYANAIARTGLDPSTWTALHLEVNQPFRSAADLEQTLKQFETVVWYRGEQTILSKVLGAYGDGIGPYLDAGGRMFIESLNPSAAMSTSGALTSEFVDRYLNCDGVFQYPLPPDSSAAWGLSSSTTVLSCPSLADSLLNRRILVGLRAFRTRDASQILIAAPAHSFTQDNPFPMPVALDVPQAHGGRFIVDTYPLVSATISVPDFPQRASIVLSKILDRLGLTGP
jgi:hypothetical protein